MKEKSLYVLSGTLTLLSVLAMLIVAFMVTNGQQSSTFPFAAMQKNELVSPVPTPLVEDVETQYAFESPIPYRDVLEKETIARSN